MFFVLLNAYYGGAMTMFFSSEISIPFTNIIEVINAHPTWNLRMLVCMTCILMISDPLSKNGSNNNYLFDL